MEAMVMDVNQTRLCALGQLKALVEGTGEVAFWRVGATRDATDTSRRCASALPTLGSSGRTRGWCCAIWAAAGYSRHS